MGSRARHVAPGRVDREPVVCTPPAEGRRCPRPRNDPQAEDHLDRARHGRSGPPSYPDPDRADRHSRRRRGRPVVAGGSARPRPTRRLRDRAATQCHPHQLRRRRGLDGHQADEGHALLGKPDPGRRALYAHRADLSHRRHQPRRRLQRRIPDVRRRRGLLHRRQDGDPASHRCGLLRRLQGRILRRGPMGT